METSLETASIETVVNKETISIRTVSTPSKVLLYFLIGIGISGVIISEKLLHLELEEWGRNNIEATCNVIKWDLINDYKDIYKIEYYYSLDDYITLHLTKVYNTKGFVLAQNINQTCYVSQNNISQNNISQNIRFSRPNLEDYPGYTLIIIFSLIILLSSLMSICIICNFLKSNL